MEFIITLNMDNDAFKFGSEGHELARILRQVAIQTENGQSDGIATDINGNRVGYFATLVE